MYSGNIALTIIVVDNASTDGTPEFIEQQCEGVVLIRNRRNEGFAKACNRGMSLTKSEFVCLVNSDIEFGSAALSRLVSQLLENPRVGMIGPKVLNSDGTVQLSCRRFPSIFAVLSRAFALDTLFPSATFHSDQFMSSWDHQSARAVDYLSGCFLVIRRSAINDVGLLDEDFFFYGEDKDWGRRFWAQGWEVVYYPSAEVVHQASASSESNAPWYHVQQVKAELQYWAKYHGHTAYRTVVVLLMIRETIRVVAGLLRQLWIWHDVRRSKDMQRLLGSYHALQWLLGVRQHLSG
jgi:GT2 family glycosyltransferase